MTEELLKNFSWTNWGKNSQRNYQDLQSGNKIYFRFLFRWESRTEK